MSEVSAVEDNDVLLDALTKFTGAMGEAVSDICSYGLTIGETYVPFDPDPEDDCDVEDVMCSQVWVRVTDVTPTPSQGWSDDCAVVMQVGLEVGVLRCIESAEGGEAPTASEVLAAAMQSMTDMKAIYCAAMGAEVWNAIDSGQWSPMGPLGTQYGGMWTFTAEI